MPFAVPRIVQVHMPKTGGSWLRNALHVSWPTEGQEVGDGQHGSWRGIPQGLLAENTVVGTLRDPWSWYASLWIHCSCSVYKDTLREWGRGSADFLDVLYGWTHLEDLDSLPERLGVIWSPPDRDYQARRLLGFGSLYSWMVDYFYRGPGGRLVPNVFLDTAQLHDGFERITGKKAGRLPPLNTRQQHAAPVKPADSRELYDDAALEWVARVDGAVVAETFGWEPFAPASTSTWRPT